MKTTKSRQFGVVRLMRISVYYSVALLAVAVITASRLEWVAKKNINNMALKPHVSLLSGGIASKQGAKLLSVAPAVLISPVLTGGPSNQVYQAKEVVFQNRDCRHEMKIVLPPLIPHFLQRKGDTYTPFSDSFLLDSNVLSEEHRLTTDEGGVWPLARCAVYYSSAHNSEKFAKNLKTTVDPSLQHCKRFIKWFRERTNKTICKSYKYVDYSGSMCDLAPELKGHSMFALACNLKVPTMPRGAMTNRRILGPEYDDWVGTADTIRLRHLNRIDQPTLAIQIRVPDYTLVSGRRRDIIPDGYACICIQKACSVCDRSQHVYSSLNDLVDFIGGQLQSHPAMEGITAVHIMSNNQALANSVQSGLQTSGYMSTASTSSTISALMHDYDIATQSTVFWATASSSITTNVIHARLAEGKALQSVVFWEDIWRQRARDS